VTTHYTLDLNNSLTQVLSDGTDRYLYGMGRIAQQTPNGLQYFLPDALGSARQLADPSGGIILAQSFDPYGGLLSSQGAAASPYGFAGEWGDPSGLLYLRARYYLPQAGIFTARDPFPGILTQPASLQPYLYALNNPVLYSDPSGQFVFIPLLIAAAAGGILGGLGYYGLQVLFSNDPCARWDWTNAALWGGVGAVVGAALGVGIDETSKTHILFGCCSI
jgi:RHS repeat-associated protein